MGNLMLNGISYTGGGGGGSTVIPNPIGEPAGTLNTIGINNVIYDIPGSGGGGEGFDKKLLYTTGSYTTGCPYQQDVPLLDNLSKYDFISVETGTITDNSSGGVKIDVAWYDVSEILQNDVYAHWAGYSTRWWQAKFTDTTFNLANRGSESGSYIHEIFKIFGYKINSGGGSGKGYDSTLLWDYIDDNNNVIPYGTYNVTLHDDIDNYDILIAEIVSAAGDLSAAGWQGTNLWTIDVNGLNNSEVQNYLNYTSFGERSSRFYIKDTTFQKTTDNQGNTNGLVKVYGVKFSGDSDEINVEPNPTDEPTDTLSTIRIGDTVFDIAGSGGGLTETILWSGENSATMILSDSFENYDFIMIVGTAITDQGNYRITNCWSVDYLKDHINDGVRFGLTGDTWYVYFSITNNTTFTRQDQNIAYISEIKGLKISGSGGSGTTSEIIPITAGDDTTTRTFTFNKTPQFIKFYWQDATLDGGWATDGDMLWGQPYMNYRSKRMGATVGNVDGGICSIAYGADNKSITITGGNAFGTMNSINGSGYMLVDYGEGGSGEQPETSDYIPYSNYSNICCEATLDNFDDTALEWGDGNSPIILSQTVSMYNDEAVLIPVNTGGVIAYADIIGDMQPFTAYIVCKANTSGQYTRILSALQSHAKDKGMMIFGTTSIKIGSWEDEYDTQISATSDYIVGVIQFIGYGLGYGKINNTELKSFPLTNSSRYITIGRTDKGSGGDQEPCDILVKYFGIVEGVDTHAAITKNVSHLMEKFNIL